ncbi:hypothetical protein EDB87DRAFT_1637500, partial [Lactarius vividus]
MQCHGFLALDTMTNTPSTGLLLLPLELLDEVIDYVAAAPQEILSLRRGNKALCSLVTPAAFRTIVVHKTDESAQGFLELLVSTDIAKHVRVIQIVEDPVLFDIETERDKDERFKRVGIRLRGVCFMLHLIPFWNPSSSQFFPDEDASWKDPFSYSDELTRDHLFQWDILEGLACKPNPLPALLSLQIDNLFAYPDDLYAAAPFQRIVT